MKNEKLKKKIVDIVRYWYVNEKDYGYIFDFHIEEKINAIADALIAAGIGDVSELKKHRVVVEKSLIPEDDNAYVLPNIPPTVKQLYSGEEVEKIVKERKELKDELRSKVEYIHEQDEVVKEYKHRAEVAEKAFSNCIENFVKFQYEQKSIQEEYKHRAEVAEKMFNILYEETSEYMKVLSKEWYKYQAEKELAEEEKDD